MDTRVVKMTGHAMTQVLDIQGDTPMHHPGMHHAGMVKCAEMASLARITMVIRTKRGGT